MRFFLLLTGFFVFFAAQANEAGGKQLFSNLKDLLVRVKAADSVSSPKASYGTGFVVDKSGIIATNYHVISDYVMQPGDQWKIIVETPDSQNLEAELIDLSVVDDLALIRVRRSFPGAIKFEEGQSHKGERTFSLGLPNDINMSLIEGVYNGTLNYGPYSLVHLSTPLNGGMSGGPSVNSAGKLVGVNVSRILFASNISFIVPVERLKTLVKNSDFKRAILTKKEAEEKIYSQIETAQEKLVASLPKEKLQKIELWKDKTIELPDFLKCWSSGTEDPQLPYVSKKRTCRLDHAVFLAGDLDSGTFNIEVSVLDASQVNRFAVNQLIGDAGAMSTVLAKFQEKKFFGEIDAREVFSPYKCDQSFLKTTLFGEEKTLRNGVCLRKYTKAKNLYDFSFSWYDFEGPLKTRIDVEHSGVSLENTKKLLAYWAERFK